MDIIYPIFILKKVIDKIRLAENRTDQMLNTFDYIFLYKNKNTRFLKNLWTGADSNEKVSVNTLVVYPYQKYETDKGQSIVVDNLGVFRLHNCT